MRVRVRASPCLFITAPRYLLSFHRQPYHFLAPGHSLEAHSLREASGLPPSYYRCRSSHAHWSSLHASTQLMLTFHAEEKKKGEKRIHRVVQHVKDHIEVEKTCMAALACVFYLLYSEAALVSWDALLEYD